MIYYMCCIPVQTCVMTYTNYDHADILDQITPQIFSNVMAIICQNITFLQLKVIQTNHMFTVHYLMKLYVK